MKVSDRLTESPSSSSSGRCRIGWQQISAQFGTPMCGPARERRAGAHLRGRLRQARRHGARLQLGPRPRVPARLGRRAAGDRSGQRPIDNQLFFVRVAQRIMHLLTMHSARRQALRGRCAPAAERQGRHADHQHRAPSQQYQRARGLDLGAPGAAARPRRRRRRRSCGRAIRGGCACDVLRQLRASRHACARKCAACASACAASCRRPRPAEFDLKQDPGGIADIEFLAQYWALLWAEPTTRRWPVRRYDPATGERGLGGAGAAGDGRRADGRLSQVPRAAVHHSRGTPAWRAVTCRRARCLVAGAGMAVSCTDLAARPRRDWL